MVQFIDENKPVYGIQAICRVLPIAASTYYRAKELEFSPEKRSQRSQHDDFYLGEIKRIWTQSKCRYGARKVWQQLKSEEIHPARCTVERLMRQHGMQGIWRGRDKITAKSGDYQQRADDLVNRNFNAHRPNYGYIPILSSMCLPALSLAGRCLIV